MTALGFLNTALRVAVTHAKQHSTRQSLLDTAAVRDGCEQSWDLKGSRQELHVRTALPLSCLGQSQ